VEFTSFSTKKNSFVWRIKNSLEYKKLGSSHLKDSVVHIYKTWMFTSTKFASLENSLDLKNREVQICKTRKFTLAKFKSSGSFAISQKNAIFFEVLEVHFKQDFFWEVHFKKFESLEFFKT
jgi:hypothetical protein